MHAIDTSLSQVVFIISIIWLPGSHYITAFSTKWIETSREHLTFHLKWNVPDTSNEMGYELSMGFLAGWGAPNTSNQSNKEPECEMFNTPTSPLSIVTVLTQRFVQLSSKTVCAFQNNLWDGELGLTPESVITSICLNELWYSEFVLVDRQL